MVELLHDCNEKVIGITKTSNRHDAIRDAVVETTDDQDRFSVETYDEAAATSQKFQNVVFCAPPSGFDDYPAAIQNVMDNLWAGPSSGGHFVFTSSGGM